MTVGIYLYRARVGGFRDRAAKLSVFKLAFISASEICLFLVLYLEGSRGINVALILFILHPTTCMHTRTEMRPLQRLRLFIHM